VKSSTSADVYQIRLCESSWLGIIGFVIYFNDQKVSSMKLDIAILEQAKQQYEDTMTDANRGVRDPVITMFAMAMKIAGFIEAPDRDGGCSKLRACPICPVGKGNYSTRYKKHGVVAWGCPHCQNITDQCDEQSCDKGSRDSGGELSEMTTAIIKEPAQQFPLDSLDLAKPTAVLLTDGVMLEQRFILDAIEEVEFTTGALLSEDQMQDLLVSSGYSKVIVTSGEVETQVREGLSSALALKVLGEKWPTYGDPTDRDAFFRRFNAAANTAGYRLKVIEVPQPTQSRITESTMQ
jgi:hypothetical protein